METTYLIISTENAQAMNFSGLEQTFESCRKSNDESMCLISYNGSMPNDTFDGVTIINTMDTQECLTVMQTPEWFIESEE
jgi:hypothetical protein